MATAHRVEDEDDPCLIKVQSLLISAYVDYLVKHGLALLRIGDKPQYVLPFALRNRFVAS